MKDSKDILRILTVSTACFLLSGCSGLVDRFLNWAGLGSESHKSICLIVMPPRVASYSHRNDSGHFEAVEYTKALADQIKDLLKNSPNFKDVSPEKAALEERKYYVVRGMRSSAPERCGYSTRYRISPDVDYRQCITAWVEQDIGVIRPQCGDRPAFFVAGTEIIMPNDGGSSATVKMPLINVGTSITASAQEVEVQISSNELINLKSIDLISKVTQIAARPIADKMEVLLKEAEKRNGW